MHTLYKILDSTNSVAYIIKHIINEDKNQILIFLYVFATYLADFPAVITANEPNIKNPTMPEETSTQRYILCVFPNLK